MEFKYLEHTADLKFQAEGKNLKHAFRNAAKAMFNSIVKIDTIQPKIEKNGKFCDSETIDQEQLELLTKKKIEVPTRNHGGDRPDLPKFKL